MLHAQTTTSACCGTGTDRARGRAPTLTAVTSAAATAGRARSSPPMGTRARTWTSAASATISAARTLASTRSAPRSALVPTATCSAMIGRRARVCTLSRFFNL